MGNFDVNTPVGSDLLSQGDDKIREFKNAMREALRAGEAAGDDIEGVEAIFPGSSPSTAPVYRYRGLKGTTAERPTAGQYGLYYDTDRKVLQRDNGTSWEDIGQMVLDGSITEAKLSTSVAGNGLSGGANTPLSVNVGTGLEISSDTVRIAAAAAGNGLSGGAGSALDVNVDNSTIEINSDALRVKDAGITSAKLAPAVLALIPRYRYVNDALLFANNGSGVYNTLYSYSGVGRLIGVESHYVDGATNVSIRIILDGTTYTVPTTINNPFFSVQQSSGYALAFNTVTGTHLHELNVLFTNSIVISVASLAGSYGNSAIALRVEYGA